MGRRTLLGSVGAIIALTLAACGDDTDTNPTPGPDISSQQEESGATDQDDPTADGMGTLCVGTLTWSLGSMPSPHSYEWIIDVDKSGDADFSLHASDANGKSGFHETIEIDASEQDIVNLCDELRTLPEDINPSIGGKNITWEMDFGRGYHTDPQVLETLVSQATDLVGEDAFNKAVEGRDAWYETQLESPSN